MYYYCNTNIDSRRKIVKVSTYKRVPYRNHSNVLDKIRKCVRNGEGVIVSKISGSPDVKHTPPIIYSSRQSSRRAAGVKHSCNAVTTTTIAATYDETQWLQ